MWLLTWNFSNKHALRALCFVVEFYEEVLCEARPGVEAKFFRPRRLIYSIDLALLPNCQALQTQAITPYSRSPRLLLKQVKLSVTMAFARLVESTSHFIPGKALSQVMPLR